MRHTLYPGRVLILAVSLGVMAMSCARDYVITPDGATACQDRLSETAQQLQPGDTLRLGKGRYTQTCMRSLSLRGTAAQPVIVYGDPHERAVIYLPPTDMSRVNNLELVDSHHVVIRGLSFEGGSIGIRIMGGHDIVFENNKVSQTGTTAIAMNYSDVHRITVRANEISYTGLADDAPGEGIYAGCNRATCTTRDSRFVDNYIHDLRGDRSGGNDGIEIKVGSGGNIVRGNRIVNTQINAAFPCIFVYGGGARPNLVENNLLIRCGEAIQVVSDALIRNNIVFRSGIAGIVSAPHQQNRTVKNVYIINNTIIDAPVCAALEWRNGTNLVFANNALYCETSTALDINGSANALMLTNAWIGKLKGIGVGHIGLYPAAANTRDLNDPEQHDFAPTAHSRLRLRATRLVPGAPRTDFRGQQRHPQGFATVGAIE